MENTIPTSATPQLPPSEDAILDKLKTIAGEHFDDYLLVVSKDKMIWNTYSSRVSAYGMASMVVHDINQDWWNGRSNK